VTTTTEFATKALKRINVIAAGETLSAADSSDAITALGEMFDGWESEGLSGLPADVTLLDARFTAGVVAMLAVRMAEDFGKQIGPVLQRDADNGWTALQSAFIAVPQSTFDRALKWTGNYTDYGYFLGNTIDALSKWTGSTAYQLRDTISNNANIYECTTAGTSAASGGPTGTGDGITDGTCVWIWRRVEGSRSTGLQATT